MSETPKSASSGHQLLATKLQSWAVVDDVIFQPQHPPARIDVLLPPHSPQTDRGKGKELYLHFANRP